MRIVIALGGNALVGHDQSASPQRQLQAIANACETLATVCAQHDVVITHGSGPQVGQLAVQTAAAAASGLYQFDVLDAQAAGMLGYLIERELRNRMHPSHPVVTILTMILVSARDLARIEPTKFVGTSYSEEQADDLHRENGWEFRREGDRWRRVVPSPAATRVVQLDAARRLLSGGYTVICGGGGGIPVLEGEGGALVGIDAVVDKDDTSSVIAAHLPADRLVIATNVDGVYDGWGDTNAQRVRTMHPDAFALEEFRAGSMRPKVAAAASFARTRFGDAVIGSLDELDGLVSGEAGTCVTTSIQGVSYW